MTIVITACMIALVLLITLAALLWRLVSRTNDLADTAEWFADFSMDSYAPMERLLDRSDFKFLEAQPGYEPQIGARLLKQRKKLFLGYLYALIGDFNRLVGVARSMIVHSSQDRAEFAETLWRQQASFYLAVCAVRVRVAIYPVAWAALDVSKLVQTLEGVRNQVMDLGFNPMASGQSA